MALSRPQPPGNQGQGRRPPSNTSPLGAFSLLSKRTLLVGVESKVSIRSHLARGRRGPGRSGGRTGGRKRGIQEGGSGFSEGGSGVPHPLSALRGACGGLSASGPKATTREPGPGPPQPAQGCDGWSPGAGAARGCSEVARGAQGALGRAGLGGSKGKSQRLNVKSKRG